jgi:hypothetical protein
MHSNIRTVFKHNGRRVVLPEHSFRAALGSAWKLLQGRQPAAQPQAQ